MDFISKALEKAKALYRQKEPDGDLPLRPEDHSGAGAASLDLRRFMEPADNIAYSFTRTIPVDLDFLRRQRIIVDGEKDTVAEQYKLLRTRILQRTKTGGRNTLMVTGALPNEGKTLTAINLAISISREIDLTVLLVDVDLRYPSLHHYFGFPEDLGLVDYLTAGVPLQEILVHPQGIAKLVILPGGRIVPNSAELIGSPRMAELVRELKSFYPNRYVLFDLPPLLSYADALAFAPLMDGIILVVEAGRTPRENIQQCLERLKGLPLLGCVLNKMEIKDHSYYYRYYYRDKVKTPKTRLPRWFKK